MDLTGINNCNEYYTNHYFASIFEENAAATIQNWRTIAKEEESIRTPWAMLKDAANKYGVISEKCSRLISESKIESYVIEIADLYLKALGYEKSDAVNIEINPNLHIPVYVEVKKNNGAPLLWVILANNADKESNIMEGYSFEGIIQQDDNNSSVKTEITNEALATQIFFSSQEPPRWILFIGLNQIALVDRNKWAEKRLLHFDIDTIFSRREESALQAMSVLLHKESLCPEEGNSLLDTLDENSHRHSAGVSQDLKYALRECIELLGNEVLYDLVYRLNRDLDSDPVDPAQLTIECLRYMYRMLFVLFIEARPELGYVPIKEQTYFEGYSLESLRDIADKIREETSAVGDGYYLHETLAKLFDLIYKGYPGDDETLKKLMQMESLHDIFVMEPLKAHIFDPEFTSILTKSKIRNSVMLKIIDLMSITRQTNGRNARRGRISYAALGINQLGAVYEALLSYRGFIAEQTLFEVKRAGDEFNELDVGYFVPESELDNYTEEERARTPDGKLRKYEKGKFIYRLAGREREKSASYYTPECLTKCLVKYALKELLEDKTADDILELKICEPAMGSAAFLNEAINQLAEAYIEKKEKELGQAIPFESRWEELQKVKMYIADKNVYGVDLNPTAVELAEVSLWLNTIHPGGYVPWFNTQLINGNSLIGARKQCYSLQPLQERTAANRWYNFEPDRIKPNESRKPKSQVYHFLLGDPGMSDYTDKVIKSIAEDNIKAIKSWKNKFTLPYSENDIETLLRLSSTIDELWKKQVGLRKTIEKETRDSFPIFGKDNVETISRTTIREKDLIYKKLYKSEEMENAGPYARLKFAMDYWCSLWFWPIEKADLLPSREEFLFEMSLILEGGIVKTTKSKNSGQMALFPTALVNQTKEINDLYFGMGDVNLDDLCKNNPRLKLSKEIAERNKFMHWELEFADVFADRGGFDLIIGNPPWIKMTWEEKNILSDKNPLLAVKKLSATQIKDLREKELKTIQTKELYFSEYETLASIQNFLNATQNYIELKGQQTNLYKCFMPQAWHFSNEDAISAFIHPDSIYDDPNGGFLRKVLYPKLRKHFQFINEKLLFAEVGHPTIFSLNIYSNKKTDYFDSIANLFEPSTIDQCYYGDSSKPVQGIKDENNEWNIVGHKDRILKIAKNELNLFANVLDNSDDYLESRLPALHVKQFINVLERFKKQISIQQAQINTLFSEMLHETNSQNEGTINRNTNFPETPLGLICSGPHVGLSNPLFKTPRKVCIEKADYDRIDLTFMPVNYLPRSNYSLSCDIQTYSSRTPVTSWESNYINEYRLLSRKMLNLKQERTLMSAIFPRQIGHTNGIMGIACDNLNQLCVLSGTFSSIPFDFFIKMGGKTNLCSNNADKLPVINTFHSYNIVLRALLLNCLTENYIELWVDQYNESFSTETWAKVDERLNNNKFSILTQEWNWNTPLRADYERRQALVEIDVLTSMALGLTLEQLKLIYRIQFPVLKMYEEDTWYDKKGRIIFTINRGLTGVGLSRAEWEQVKDYQAGRTVTQTIVDDTQPGGPTERTIEYIAPFDKCDREQDYETAWKFFDEKFKQEGKT